MSRRNDPVDGLVDDLNDLAKQRGWQPNGWGYHPLIDRGMTLNRLEAVAAALGATLTLEVRPKEQP